MLAMKFCSLLENRKQLSGVFFNVKGLSEFGAETVFCANEPSILWELAFVTLLLNSVIHSIKRY